MSHCAFDIIFSVPDLANLMFQRFQQNEESFFVRSVCKKWYKIIQTKKIPLDRIIGHYAHLNSFSSLHLLRSYIQNDRNFFVEDLFAKGTPEVLEWALATALPTTDYITAIQIGLARCGSWQLFKNYVPIAGVDDEKCCAAAASNGQLDFLKHLYNDYGIQCNTSTLKAASENGDLNIVKWLKTHNRWDQSAVYAAKAGHIHLLEFLKDEGYFIGAFDAACINGQLKVLDWLLANNKIEPAQDCYYVIKSNNPDMYKWAVVNCPNWGPRDTSEAVRTGNLELIKYCFEKNCPWDYRACDVAAEKGHFEVLKWLVAYGCTIDDKTCEAAASFGHFEILKWLRETNNCFLDKKTTIAAAKVGRQDIIQWAVEKHGLSYCIDLSYGAAFGGHIELLKWLLEQGCTWDDCICEKASEGGQLEMLIWCIENGRTMSVKNCLRAAQCRGYKKNIVEWIVNQQTVDYSNVAPPTTLNDISEFFSGIEL